MTKGYRIKSLREEKGFTLEALANALDVAPQTIFKYENNIITNIPSEKIKLMADLFDVSPDYLMLWQDERKKFSQMKYDSELFPIFDKFQQLDDLDRIKINERIDFLLEDEKYNKKVESEA